MRPPRRLVGRPAAELREGGARFPHERRRLVGVVAVALNEQPVGGHGGGGGGRALPAERRRREAKIHLGGGRQFAE